MTPSDTDSERAGELGAILLEVLRFLNRAEVEGEEVAGLEHGELLTHLRRGLHPEATGAELDTALTTLLGNRMIIELDDPEFAWDRGRTVGRRYALSLTGKEYLLQKLERSGRIE